MQSPEKPFLFYFCYHTSCKKHTFKEARAKISGQESLAKYYPGYDPSKRSKKPGTELGAVLAKSSIPYQIEFECLSPRIPPPHEVDPYTFFEEGARGTLSFVPKRLADYMAVLLGPLYETLGTWWRYENGVYRRMDVGELQHVATVALRDHARPNQVNAAVEILGNLVRRRPSDWPKEKLINCLTGMLNPETGKLEPHSPAYLSRVQIKCKYDWKYLDAAQPFMEFLEGAQPGKDNEACRTILHRFGGYVLLPDNRYEKVLLLKGEGGNGKGTFINILSMVIGEEHVSALSLHDLGERFNTYRLETSILNVSTEVNPKKSVETETLKQVVSGDLIKGEEKFGKQFEFRPRTKCIFSLNKKPILQDVGYALERRLIVVPFDTTFEGKTKVESIWDRCVEGDGRHGVFMWMVLGLEELLKNGFELTGRVKSTTTAFLRSLNPVMIFVQDVCRLRPGDNKVFVGTVELYKRYVQWCGHTKHKEMARTNFWDIIESIPGVRRGLHHKTRQANFFGIEIKPEDLGEEAEGYDDLEEVDPSTPQPRTPSS